MKISKLIEIENFDAKAVFIGAWSNFLSDGIRASVKWAEV